MKETNLSATDVMCKHCFDIIIDEVSTHDIDELSAHKTASGNSIISIEQALGSNHNTKCPLFVTWDIAKHSHHRHQNQNNDATKTYHLRGCIGTLAPQKLRSALGEYAKISAFQDHRFSPISREEIPHLRVSVSLLVNYEECDYCLDWDVGVHGIIINFRYQNENYSATFLPEVAKEQRWTTQETINALVKKSGFRHSLSDNLQRSIRCTRYQSSKQYLTYQDYVNMNGAIPIESIVCQS